MFKRFGRWTRMPCYEASMRCYPLRFAFCPSKKSEANFMHVARRVQRRTSITFGGLRSSVHSSADMFMHSVTRWTRKQWIVQLRFSWERMTSRLFVLRPRKSKTARARYSRHLGAAGTIHGFFGSGATAFCNIWCAPSRELCLKSVSTAGRRRK